MASKRSFWINLCLFNLCIVAFLGFSLRSKILFPIDFVNYRNFLSAHSHFAFAGWAGLSLITLLVYDLLPPPASDKKIYQWLLVGIETSSLGMAFTFPFFGYNGISIFFSTLYIVIIFVFAPVFLKDIVRISTHKTVKLLSITAILALIISFLGTLGLAYILLAHSRNSILYRDSIYVFLHFQYNGFFTASAFALFFHYAIKKGAVINQNGHLFAVCLCLSIIPALFLSLLWHNSLLFYILAFIGCVFMILGVIYFFIFLRRLHAPLFSSSTARVFWLFSMFSFILKMLLNSGTIFPALGNAVYADRPVIIGFLHLVFLGFITFYILSVLIEDGYFTKNNRIVKYPLWIFSIGIISTEFFLMLQGLGILLKTNHDIFKWLLWGASVLLFGGALLIVLLRFSVIRTKMKKP